MNVNEAIAQAEAILPGVAAPEDEKDPRWQAIIAVGEFIGDQPEAVWPFVERWGAYPDDDLQAAIGTCLMEHLLEYHFDLVFPRMERLARSNPDFAHVVDWCWTFGEAERPENAARLQELKAELRIAR
jgi:hypothetical protein